MEPLRDFSDVQVMARGVEVAGRCGGRAGAGRSPARGRLVRGRPTGTFHPDVPTTTTDAEGRFGFPHVRPGHLVLQVKAEGVRAGVEGGRGEGRRGAGHVSSVRRGPSRPGRGRQGKPIPGPPPSTSTPGAATGHWACSSRPMPTARFRWEDAPADSVLIDVYHRAGFESVFRRRVSPEEGEVLLTLKRSLVSPARSATPRRARRSRACRGRGRHPGSEDRPGLLEGWFGIDLLGGSIRATHGYLGQSRRREAPEYRLRIKARGYEPFESRAFRSDEGPLEYDVKLTRTDRPQGVVVSGVVRRPDGTSSKGRR